MHIMELMIMVIRCCVYTVCEGIHLTITAKDGFDGVLDLMFFTDPDHGGNADGSSISGMMAFIYERQLFPRLLEWAEEVLNPQHR
jgi:hypothetical protein